MSNKHRDVKLEWDFIRKRCDEFLEILKGITWEDRLKIFRLYEKTDTTSQNLDFIVPFQLFQNFQMTIIKVQNGTFK